VRERDRQRHQLRRLLGRVAEHHSLVPSAREVELIAAIVNVTRLVGLIDPLRDIRRLLIQSVEHGARVSGEAEIGVDVPDLPDRLADDLLHVERRLGRDLTGNHDEPGVDERLARHPAIRILVEYGIEHSV
jgi:hypothetical protein